MTQYWGFRDADGQAHVVVRDDSGGEQPLSHFVRHSPSGFEWGYGGSGPADLARSILAHHLGGDVAPPPRIYQFFKFAAVTALPKNEWTLTSDEVASRLDQALRSLDVKCARCGDQGLLWPEQRRGATSDRQPERCDCEEGAEVCGERSCQKQAGRAIKEGGSRAHDL
jgi:hypothetical protein